MKYTKNQLYDFFFQALVKSAIENVKILHLVHSMTLNYEEDKSAKTPWEKDAFALSIELIPNLTSS